jgi:RNA polymerase I-specific transcription initiation factor RRN3
MNLHRYPQIEKNKSVHLSQFFTGSYATGGALRDTGFEFDDEKWTHLEACFPFDPFQLPVARRWLDLQNSYVTWSPMAVLARADEGDEEDSGEEEEEEGEEDYGDGVESELDGEFEGAEVVDARAFQEDTATDDGEGDFD